jgi:hypothetical protein
MRFIIEEIKTGEQTVFTGAGDAVTLPGRNPGTATGRLSRPGQGEIPFQVSLNAEERVALDALRQKISDRIVASLPGNKA